MPNEHSNNDVPNNTQLYERVRLCRRLPRSQPLVQHALVVRVQRPARTALLNVGVGTIGDSLLQVILRMPIHEIALLIKDVDATSVVDAVVHAESTTARGAGASRRVHSQNLGWREHTRLSLNKYSKSSADVRVQFPNHPNSVLISNQSDYPAPSPNTQTQPWQV